MPSNYSYAYLSAVQLSRIDELCNRFEAAHQNGATPTIEEYLSEVEKPLQMLLFKELLKLKSHYVQDIKVDSTNLTLRFPDLDAATITNLLLQNSTKNTLGQFPVVDGYSIVSELGRGGMGVVYKAQDLRLDRFVALKMMHPEGPNREQVVARMLTEARAAAHLQHPNLVPIYEVRECDGCPVLVFEYVDGGTLAERIARQPIEPDIAAHMMETLAKVLAYAHSRGIVHRDLKPANILIAQDGTLKVSDFGLARQLDDDHRQTKSGMLIGTPGYMAPEQASGNAGELGPAADIHGLGAILYEMLSGQPAFRGTSILETLEMVRTQDPISPRRLRRSVPPDLETICLKCLRKNPNERYLSASLLSNELGRFLRQEPIMARPIGRLEQINRWCRRNPREAGLASLSLLVSVACFFAVLWAWQKTAIAFESEKARAANEKRQNEEAQKIAIASNRRFDKAAASAEELLRVSQRLLNQPNMDTLGRETFEKAMKFKQSLIEESNGSDGTSLEIARALGGFAVTQGELGLYSEALVTLQQSIAAIQSLDESARQSPESQREMISMLLRQCGFFSHLNREDESLESIRQALTIGERLLESDPSNCEDMVRLANLLVNITAHTGTAAVRKEQLMRAIDLERQALEVQPANGYIRFELALALQSLASMYISNDTKKAKELMQESVAYFEQSLPKVGVPKVRALYFASACRSLTRIYASEKEYGEARRVLQKGFNVIQTTAKAFPNYGDGRTEYANNLLVKARLSVDLNENQLADSLYADAMREVTQTTQLFPADRLAFFVHFDVATEWSGRLESMKRFRESVEVRRETIIQCKIWREKDPKKQANSARIEEALRSSVHLSMNCDATTKKVLIKSLVELANGNLNDVNAVAWSTVCPKSASIEDGLYATKLVTQAIALQPENAALQSTLGLASLRAGKLDEARAALEKSLAMSKTSSGSNWYVLALVCQKEDKRIDAAAYLAKAVLWRLLQQPFSADLKSLEAEVQELLAAKQL